MYNTFFIGLSSRVSLAAGLAALTLATLGGCAATEDSDSGSASAISTKPNYATPCDALDLEGLATCGDVTEPVADPSTIENFAGSWARQPRSGRGETFTTMTFSVAKGRYDRVVELNLLTGVAEPVRETGAIELVQLDVNNLMNNSGTLAPKAVTSFFSFKPDAERPGFGVRVGLDQIAGIHHDQAGRLDAVCLVGDTTVCDVDGNGKSGRKIISEMVVYRRGQ